MKNISRRRFIEDTLFASFSACAAATLAGGVLPRQVLAQQPVAANDRLGVAIVSGSGRARVLGNYFGLDSRSKVLYYCDPDLGRAVAACKDIEKKYGYLPEAVADFRKVLENKSVDIVACAATNHWHVLTAIWAMQAGKHCYIEKPLSHNLHEGKAIVAAAKKYRRLVQTGTQSRSTTNINEAVEFVRSGGIGDVKFVRGLCYFRRKAIGPIGEYPVPPDVDYDLWCGPAEMKPPTRRNFHYDWHWQREYGNGDLGNQGVHKIDVSAWLLGINRFPQSVIAYGGRLGYENEVNNPDYRDAGDVANTQTVIYDFGDKSLVFEVRALETSPYGIPVGTTAGPFVGNIAYGTDGYVVQGAVGGRKDSFTLSYVFDKNGQMVKEFKSVDDKGTLLTEYATTERHVANFLDAVVADDPKKLTANGRCGELSAALVHLGNISYFLGEKNKVSADTLKQALRSVKPLDDNEATLARTLEHLETNGVDVKKTPLSLGPMLKIDVDKEIIVGNPEADALTTRHYRTGYVVPLPQNV